MLSLTAYSQQIMLDSVKCLSKDQSIFLLNQVYRVEELSKIKSLDSLESSKKDILIKDLLTKIDLHEEKHIAQHAIKEALASKVKQGKKVIRKQRLVIVGLVVLSVIFGIK